MTISEFLQMYKADPNVQEVVEVESVEEAEGFCRKLYHILFKDRTAEYGRHAGLRVRLNRVLEVIEHDIFNMTIDNFGNWVEAVRTWYLNWSAGGTTTATYYASSAGSTSATSYTD